MGIPFAMVVLAFAVGADGQQQKASQDQLTKGRANAENRSDPAKAYLDRGLALFNKGDKAGAIAAYRTAIRLRPGYAEAHNSLGVALSDKGKLDAAIAEFRTAVRLNPNYAEAHNGLGVMLKLKGDVEGAIAEYRLATRLKPDYFYGHYDLGSALQAKGDVEGAVPELREAVRLKPDDADAHVELGNALFKRDPDGAAAEFREAVRLQPDDARAKARLTDAINEQKASKYDFSGLAYLVLDNCDKAIADFREAIRLRPEDAEWHAHLSDAFSCKRDLDGALAESQEAVRLEPGLAQAHYFLGKALEAKGKKGAALNEYKRATELDPKDASASEAYQKALQERFAAPAAKASDLDPTIAHEPAGDLCADLKKIVADAPSGFASLRGEQVGQRKELRFFRAKNWPAGAVSCKIIDSSGAPPKDRPYTDYDCDFPLQHKNEAKATIELAQQIVKCLNLPEDRHPMITTDGDSALLSMHSSAFDIAVMSEWDWDYVSVFITSSTR